MKSTTSEAFLTKRHWIVYSNWKSFRDDEAIIG